MGLTLGTMAVIALAKNSAAISNIIQQGTSERDPNNIIGDAAAASLPRDWLSDRASYGKHFERINRTYPLSDQGGFRWRNQAQYVQPPHPQASIFNPAAVIDTEKWSAAYQHRLSEALADVHPLLRWSHRVNLRAPPPAYNLVQNHAAAML